MMISVADPFSDHNLNLRVIKEEESGLENWRIYFLPYQFSFLIGLQKNGEWKVLDDKNIHPALIREIGRLLQSLTFVTEVKECSGKSAGSGPLIIPLN